MDEKIVGYLLIATGVLIIFFSIFSVYRVFTNNSSPAQLFNSQGISIDLSSFVGGEEATPQQRAALQESGALKTELIEPEIINTSLNSLFHLLLMGFIASGGFKIARIGATLARPVKVNLKEKNEQTKK